MEQLLQMSIGYVPAQILRSTAELGIAEALADGPQPTDSIAKQTETDPAALRRLLRALVGLGLVEQLDEDRFGLTDLGRQLPAVREHLRLAITPELWRAWGDLATVVRTGAVSRDPGTGLTAYEAAQHDPATAALYRSAKAQASQEFTGTITGVYDFTRFGSIVEFGGDQGTLLAAILLDAPGLRAVLYDAPEALAGATATLVTAGVADRCEVTAGEPTGTIRAGADAYLLNHVVRDLTRDAALAVLRNVRAAMTPASRLLLVETVMPPVLTPQDSATYGLTDLNNLIYTGGQERTAEEYRELLETAGLTLTAVAAAPATKGLPDYNVIEAAA